MPKARKKTTQPPALPEGMKLPERAAEPAAPRMRPIDEIVADQRRNDALYRRLFAKPAKAEKRAKA